MPQRCSDCGGIVPVGYEDKHVEDTDCTPTAFVNNGP